MGEHGVVVRGAGAGAVLATWGILLKRRRQIQVLLGANGSGLSTTHARGPAHAPLPRPGPALTSVDVTVRMRSMSSTSCLKVGLCEGAACQHSRMIMYLRARASGHGHAGLGRGAHAKGRGQGPHRSCVQLAGLSMRWPSFSSLKSSSTGMPGYGEPPSVKISQRSTPKDQLRGARTVRLTPARAGLACPPPRPQETPTRRSGACRRGQTGPRVPST